MAQSFRGHWRVQIVPYVQMVAADPNGNHYGVQFTNGFAYVGWQTLGEDATRVAIGRLGEDPRFVVTEIPDREYQGNVKA